MEDGPNPAFIGLLFIVGLLITFGQYWKTTDGRVEILRSVEDRMNGNPTYPYEGNSYTEDEIIEQMTQEEKDEYFEIGKKAAVWFGVFMSGMALLFLVMGIACGAMGNPLLIVFLPLSFWFFLIASSNLSKGFS